MDFEKVQPERTVKPFASRVELILLDVWSLVVMVVDERQRLVDADQGGNVAAGRISNSEDRISPGQVVVALGDRETAYKVPAHVENGITDILGIENSCA